MGEIRLLVIIFTVFSLLAGCSGSESSSNFSDVCLSVVEIELGVQSSKQIAADQSQCYKFNFIQNKTYKISATANSEIGGDEFGIGVYRGSPKLENSLLVYDIFGPDWEVVFTADNDPSYILEIYSAVSASYSFIINEVPIDDYLSIDNSDIYISAYSDFYMPSNQRLVQPEINQVVVTSSYPSVLYHEPKIEFHGDAKPDWLGVALDSTADGQSTFVVDILHVSLEQAINKSSFRLTHGHNSYSISVFKIVNVTLNAEVPSFNVSANAPGQAVSGDQYNFSVISDVSSGALYSIEYGPNGMTVDSDGVVIWDSKLPMFKDEMDIRWGIRATLGNVSKIIDGSVKLSNPLFVEPIIRTGRTYYTFSGDLIKTGDVDGDGNIEIVISDHEKIIYAMEYSGGEYAEDSIIPYALSDQQRIHKLALGDLNNDGIDEIVAGMSDVSSGLTKSAKVFIIDGVTRKIIGEIDSVGAYISGIQVADVDADGVTEIVVAVDNGGYYIKIYEGLGFTEEWSGSLNSFFGSKEIHIGNVDGDSALEIITGGGHVIDGKTHALEWVKEGGFGWRGFAVGDSDNDGIDEICVATDSADNWVEIYSAITKGLKQQFQLSVRGTIDSVLVGDIYGSGKNSLIVANNYAAGGVFVLDYDSSMGVYNESHLLKRKSYSTMEISDLSIEDFDNDGLPELLWRERGGLVISGMHTDMSATTFDIEWFSKDPSSNGSAIFVNPYFMSHPDSSTSIVFAMAGTGDMDVSSSGQVRLAELELNTGLMKYLPSLAGVSCYQSPVLLSLDINADTYDDFIMPPCSSVGESINFDVINNQQDIVSVSSSIYLDTRAYSAEVIDLGNDGSKEVLVNAVYGRVYIYDFYTGEVVWYSDDLVVSGPAIEYVDVDGDGAMELVFVAGGSLYVYEYSVDINGFIERSKIYVDYVINDMEVNDFNNDGSVEIIVASRSNNYETKLTVFGADLNVIVTHPLNYYVTDLAVEDLSGARKNLLLGTMERVNIGSDSFFVTKIRAVDPFCGDEVWQSPSLLSDVPRDSLRYRDLDFDNDIDMFFTTRKTINVVYN